MHGARSCEPISPSDLVAILSMGCSESRELTGPTGGNPALVSLDASASGAAAASDPTRSSRADATVPFKGRLEGTYGDPCNQFPICHETITGSGNATHLGRYALAIDETVDLSKGEATGTFVLTAANGDTVSGTFDGKAQLGPQVTIVEEATIKGGTGRFAGVGGSFVIDRVFDPVDRTTSGAIDGAISLAAGSSH